MIRIDGSQAAAPQFSSQSTTAEPGTGGIGTLAGQSAVPEDAASVLTDAAEELSLYAAEKLEHKSLDEREVETEKPIDLMHIDEIAAYLEAAKLLDNPQELTRVAKQLQSGQGNPRELARRESRDPTQQYMLLQYAAQDGLKNGTAPEILDELLDALADLEVEYGPQIRSDLNTIGAASEFAAGPGGIAAFQDAYQDVVLGEASLAQTLTVVVSKLGGESGEGFVRGLQGLIKALGQDLAATRPSVDANRLQSLVQDLYHLEVASTVVDGCRKLAGELAAKHATPGIDPAALMKELVAVTGEKWVSASRFAALAEKFGVRDVGAQIAFQAGVRALMRELPVKIFPDADARQAVLNASQEALDRAIDLEEE